MPTLLKNTEGLKVYKWDMVHYLCYEVGDVVYGGARQRGFSCTILGWEKSIESKCWPVGDRPPSLL